MDAMHPTRALRPAIIATLMAGLGLPASGRDVPSDVLRRQCADCHTGGGSEGGVDLEALLAALDRGRPAVGTADHRQWEAVWRNVLAGTMPPADEPQPSVAERRMLARFVQEDVFGLDRGRPDPGHAVLRRLNRDEYARTIRDLVGVSFEATDAFPTDDTGYGFDTIGEVLTISPLLMEKYLEAARTIAARAVAPARAATRDGKGRLAYPRETRAVFFEGAPADDPAAHAAALRRLLERLATRAYRRPVDEATLDALARNST